MATFTINVVETLNRAVEVEADTLEDAFDKVEHQYHDEEIVLDSSDFAGCELTNVEGTESRYL